MHRPRPAAVAAAAALLLAALAATPPAPGWAQAQPRAETLADIRQQLSILYVEIQRLKQELSTTGGPSVAIGGPGVLDRVDTLDAEVRRLTARTEELEHRIARIVEDGTNRIGDLEFRLVELEGGDVGQLGETTTLGGNEGLPGPSLGDLGSGSTAAPAATGPELAMGEQADFDRARDAFESGDYEAAAAQFQTFTENYPGGALSGEAHFWRGEALAALEEWNRAARAYLDSFSGAPEGPRAAEALYRLGVSLDRLGQREEACLTLSEVQLRYPDAAATADALAEMQALGCN